MKYIITENKMINILHQILNKEFEGFDDIYYNWADYNCGMGVCCDPYAIGFVLPKSHYDDYLFKFVDGESYDGDGDYPDELSDDLPEPCLESPDIKDPRFDTILFYQDFAEEIGNYLGSPDNWEKELLYLLNKQFNMNASYILFI